MGKDSPSPPAAPDYAGAAQAQGAANVDTARLQGKISNPNIIGPLGSQTVTFGQPTFDQAGYDAAMASYSGQPQRGAAPQLSAFTTAGDEDNDASVDQAGYQTALTNWANSGVGGNAPTREQFTSTVNADQPTVTQTLTPNAQATLDAQQRVQRALAGLGEQGIATASNALGTAFNPNLQGVQTSLGNAGQIAQTPNLGLYGSAGANVNAQGVNAGPQAGQYGMSSGGPSAGQYGLAQGGLNTSNVAAMPVNAGMTGQQAIMARLAPQLERADAATRQRLINQGLVPGGEAYENAMISQNQQKNDLLSQAALQGIGLDTAANAQGFNQALQAGQYGNQAIAQNFWQGQAATAAQNAAVGQNFGQSLAAQQAQNAASQQLYNQYMGVQGLQNQAVGQNQQAALAQQQAALAAQNQQFNQNMQAAQFGNTAQQQSLQQQLALRNQPLNEIAGLMGGSQIQMPQFQGYQGANVTPAPIFAGAQAQNAANMQNYGIQSANVNAQNAGLYSLLGAGAQAYGMKA